MSAPELENRISEDLAKTFSDDVKAVYVKTKRMKFMVKPERIVEVGLHLKKIGFDQVVSVGGTDYPDQKSIEVNYHLASVGNQELKKVIVNLTTTLPRDRPVMSTLYKVWKGVEYHERETHEMVGIVFEGHPNLERLLLPEDWADIPPLRKDFKLPGR